MLEDMKRRMGWTEPAAPQQVSDEQQMVQAAEGSDKVADGSEVRWHLSCIFNAGHQLRRHEKVKAALGYAGMLTSLRRVPGHSFCRYGGSKPASSQFDTNVTTI